MTGSQRRGSVWALAVAGIVIALASAALAEKHETPTIEMISTNVQGKNVFIPGTIVMTAGKPQKITIFNTTDTPHGFTIAAAGIQTVLPPKEEHVVEVPALREGLYWIDCQLHPPHRNAQLLVVESSD